MFKNDVMTIVPFTDFEFFLFAIFFFSFLMNNTNFIYKIDITTLIDGVHKENITNEKIQLSDSFLDTKRILKHKGDVLCGFCLNRMRIRVDNNTLHKNDIPNQLKIE